MTLLTAENLCQYFGSVPALLDVSFAIEPGEVLGVVGQRGAGKTTLFQLLSGVYPPTDGQIIFEGEPVTFHTVAQAQRRGIYAVQQDLQLVDELTVLEHIFLGREIRGPSYFPIFPQTGEMLRIARDLLADFEVRPKLANEQVANLSDEQRQIVALSRALSRPSRLLLLDNALEALSFARQQILLNRIRDLAEQGVATILSGDDLKQIFAVTDRILVLYQGQQVALRRTSESTPHEIVELIVGTHRQERVTPMIWAFENYHAAQQQAEALERTQSELRQNLEAQDSLNRQLIDRLHNQVEALDRLNLALQEASRRLMTEREAERKALARELHDQIIQDLLSFNYQLEEAEDEVTNKSQRLKLTQIRQGIRQTVGSLRQVCSDLRPPTIDHHGLSAAIRSFASQWSEQTGIPVALEIDPSLGRLPEPIELSVFRIAQEGLRNVGKHADASRVDLTMKRTHAASLLLRLTDNGRGTRAPVNLAELAEQKHFGLVGISERVSLLDGTLEITSPPGGGMTLQIEIPIPYPAISD